MKNDEAALMKVQQGYLRRAIDLHGEAQRAAQVLGITPSRLSRLVNCKEGSGFIGIPTVFKLAGIIGETPWTILRGIGHEELADAMQEWAETPSRKPRTAAELPTIGSVVPAKKPVTDETAQALNPPHGNPVADAELALLTRLVDLITTRRHESGAAVSTGSGRRGPGRGPHRGARS